MVFFRQQWRAFQRTGRQYTKTAAMIAAGQIGENALFLFDYAVRLLRVLVLLSIWRMVLYGRGPVSGMTMASVLTYTLVSEVFGEQLHPETNLSDAFWEGSIGGHFLQPMGLFGQFTAMMLGRWAFNLAAFSLPLLALSPLLGVSPWPEGWQAALLFLPSLLLGIGSGLAVEFIAFAVLVGSAEMPPWLVRNLFRSLGTLLSGALLPLPLLPWGLGRVLAWLPFASMASAPLQIYVGTGNPVRLLCTQVIWCLILWPLAGWCWRANRERLVTHGG